MERRRPLRRFHRSRSHGNLVESSDQFEEDAFNQVGFKKCLIQQDEQEEDSFDNLESDFQARLDLTGRKPNQFRRYS